MYPWKPSLVSTTAFVSHITECQQQWEGIKQGIKQDNVNWKHELPWNIFSTLTTFWNHACLAIAIFWLDNLQKRIDYLLNSVIKFPGCSQISSWLLWTCSHSSTWTLDNMLMWKVIRVLHLGTLAKLKTVSVLSSLSPHFSLMLTEIWKTCHFCFDANYVSNKTEHTHTVHPSTGPGAGLRPSAVHSMSQFSENANMTVSEELLLKTNLLMREVTRHNKICHRHAPNSTTQKPSILLFRTSNKPIWSQLYLEFQMLNTGASIRGIIFISSFQEEWSIESWQLTVF